METIWGNTVYSLTELGNMLKPQFRKRGKIYTTHIKILLILWMSIFLLIKKLNQNLYFGQYLYFSPCSLKLPPPNLVTHTNFAHRAMDFRVLELDIFLRLIFWNIWELFWAQISLILTISVTVLVSNFGWISVYWHRKLFKI